MQGLENLDDCCSSEYGIYRGSTHRARRQVAVGTYRVLHNLVGIPGDMICERCLPADKAAAHDKDLIHEGLSGDEQPVDLQND